MASSAKLDIENPGDAADALAVALLAALRAENNLPVASALARIIGINPEGNLARKNGDVYTTEEIDEAHATFAAKGVNSDITELTGLTTPLSEAQGGTGLTDLADLPISDAMQAALDLLAPKNNAALTGTPTVPTAAPGTNTTQAANTAFVVAAINALIAAAPGALDTLDELAAALGDDANFATTVTTLLGQKLPTATAETDAKHDPGVTGVAAPFISLRDRLRVTLNATGCKLLGDDSTDNQPELQNILDDIAGWGGGRFHLNLDRDNGGVYQVDASIDLPAEVYIYGDGDRASMLKATGDFPVVQTIGTSGSVQNRGGVSKMTIWGGGKANANAHGIKIAWTNRQVFDRVRFHACRHAFDFDNVWQIIANYLHIDGSGSGQNYRGLYGRVTDPSNPNNALIAHGIMVQNVEDIGFLLRGFNGSKFTNCEVAGAGSHGWHLGVPDSGTEIVQWGHFDTILADTCTGDLFRIEKGSASAAQDFQINGLWLGTSFGGYGLHAIDASRLQIAGMMTRSTNKSAIHLDGCDNIAIGDISLHNFDQAAALHPAILLTDTTHTTVTGGSLKATSAPGAKAFTETGSSDYNRFTNVDFNGHLITLLGANSAYAMVGDEYALRHGRSGSNNALAITADDGREVYLGMGTFASPLTHSVQRTSTNQINIRTNGSARFQIGNGSGAGAGGFLNTNLQPMLDYTTTVASLPASPNGTRAWVTDATQTWPTDTGTTVTGGGANGVPVIRHGGAWKVA